MRFEENQFVRDVTLCLYSSLHIEKALFETFKYLQQFFPLDIAHMFIYDTSRDTLRYLSMATGKKGLLIDELIHISERSIREVRNQKLGSVNIYTKSKSFLIREIFTHFQEHTSNPLFKDEEDLSALAIVLDIGKPLVGGFGMVARGNASYRDEHKPMLKMIGRALTGSVLNLLHHREIVCLNERLTSEKQELQKRLGHVSATQVIGAESGLRDVMDMVVDVSPLDSPVLILGETGVGKEVIANAIHQSSNRSNGPLISINCGAIPETLIDSELFGHEKGAFTGADNLKRGYFEQANGGTIFLDEVGELPLLAQVKLLRVLQTMEFQRVGGTRSVSVDVRIITATNRNLLQMVRKNRFREDLWFRLNVFPIRIPPLRDRKNDIPAMAEYFAMRKSREMNLTILPEFAHDAFTQLQSYEWPGNIRELSNVIERALIVSRGKKLSFPNLNTEPQGVDSGHREENLERFLQMDEVIVNHIRSSLALSNGRLEGKGGAAALLGMNPSTLRGRMRKYGIKIQRNVTGVKTNTD